MRPGRAACPEPAPATPTGEYAGQCSRGARPVWPSIDCRSQAGGLAPRVPAPGVRCRPEAGSSMLVRTPQQGGPAPDRPTTGPRWAGTADRAGPAQMGPQSMLPSSANQAGRRGRSPHAGHAPRPRAGSDQGLLSLGLAQASGRYNDYNIVVNCYDIVMNFTML